MRVFCRAFLLFVCVFALCACENFEATRANGDIDFNFITAEEVAAIVRENKDEYAIIDIQPEDAFDKAHLKGAVSTGAYPVKSNEAKQRVKIALQQVLPGQKIIIVCPRGGGGAKNTVLYYNRKLGVDNSRLFILQNGQEGWPENLDDVLEQQ